MAALCSRSCWAFQVCTRVALQALLQSTPCSQHGVVPLLWQHPGQKQCLGTSAPWDAMGGMSTAPIALCCASGSTHRTGPNQMMGLLCLQASCTGLRGRRKFFTLTQAGKQELCLSCICVLFMQIAPAAVVSIVLSKGLNCSQWV